MESSPEIVTKEEGLRLLKAGQLDDAIGILEKVKAKGPEDAQVCSYLGAAYNQKGDKLNAIAAFEEAVRIEESPKGYYNLGLVYESVKRVDEAVRQYRMALVFDANYAPAQQAIDKLHAQYEASHPQPQAVAQPTQSIPAGPPPVGQTQTFAGPPAPGPAVGGAPSQLADPFARQYAPPPTQQDFMMQQMAKQQAIVDQQHALMKSGLIYGAICGFISFVVLSFAMGMLVAVLGGHGFIYLLIQGCIGAAFGAMVGLWVGYTCGGDGAGFQAGAVLGGLYGLGMGLISGAGMFAIIGAGVDALLFGIAGYFIGRMVDASIRD